MPPEDTDAAPPITEGTAAPAAGKESGRGYPSDTPVAEMTADQQAAYWKAQARKHEARVKQAPTPDELKVMREAMTELDELRSASMGELERAVASAKAEGATAAAEEFRLKLVAAEFRYAAAGHLEPEELTELIDPLDLRKFLDDNGDVDTEKVSAWVGIKLQDKGAAGQPRRFPDLGQGTRPITHTPSVAAGRAAYEARHGNRRRTA
jgi:hypothetical protein